METDENWQCPFPEEPLRQACPQYSHANLEKFLQNKQFDYSLGCMFGSFIGDSLGAYLEFAPHITPPLVQQAMEMTPGGSFNLRAGQVTDDSEMSFHLLEALSHFEPHQQLEEQRVDLILEVARGYVGWKKSRPFDIGITTRNGLKLLEANQQRLRELAGKEREEALGKVFEKVMEVNHKSESNGSLMRITPLVFFTTLLSLYSPDPQLAALEQFVRDEVRLVHPNPRLVHSSLHWVKTLYMLTRRDDNRQLERIYEQSIGSARKNLAEWVEVVESKAPMEATENKGWAKIAWSYGMRELQELKEELRKNQNYPLDEHYFTRVLRSVLERGGDTDTNMAIVGGMIGSIVGFKRLPSRYLQKMMQLDFSNPQLKGGNDRPSFYEPRKAFLRAYESLQKLREFRKQGRRN